MKRKIPYILFGIAFLMLMAFLVGFGFFQKRIDPISPIPSPSMSAKIANDFSISIPSLNLSAPVISDVDGTNKDAYFKALQEGVAHFKGTSKPGQGSNIVIFGHSSYYTWDPGKYKEIFKLLGDLKNGDEIILHYNQKDYRYKVTSSFAVSPDDVSVLKPSLSEQLTLITCWPPGTIQKRLIIIAKPS